MKKRIWSMILVTCVMVIALFAKDVTAMASDNKKSIDIVFTHDLHSHLDSFTTYYDNEYRVLGGFARIMTVIQEKKEKNPDTLVVDAGDFSMGTLIQTVFENSAAELRLLGELGSEVTVLGNHEFDYRSEGLANMMNTAADSGEAVPPMVLCNVDWEAMRAAGLNDGQQALADAFANYDVKDYIVVTKGDVKVAIVGVFGKDSLACAPTCELLFKDPVEAVKATVETIKANEDVDMILCVSHSGTWEDESKSEDEILAKSVPELDIIVSGHTHTELSQPIKHGDTYIVSCGEYGERLGLVGMTQNESGRWNIDSYEIKLMDDSIASDEVIDSKIRAFDEAINTQYLSQFGYTKDTVLATNDVEFCRMIDLYKLNTELNLGNYLADSFKYAAENASGNNGEKIAVVYVPSGCVRDTIPMGNVTVENIFNAYSLGIGPDGVPGYPLVKVYLSGKELKMTAEIDASVAPFIEYARNYINGLHFNFNPNRLILNKVTDVYLVDDDGNRVEIDNNALYPVVVDLYTGQMLGQINDMSYGLLALQPKHADGSLVEDYEQCIIYDNGKEVKAWDAIARYTKSFEDTDGDGIANISEYYATADHGRKVVDESKNIGKLINKPNKFRALIIGVILLVIVVITLIIVGIVKLVKRLKRKEAVSYNFDNTEVEEKKAM